MDDWKTKWLFPQLGMIPIDREGGDAAERALSAAQRVLEWGELFGIYPEGTRSRDGRLYKGHTGPARLAVRTGAPLIPVGIIGSAQIQPAGRPVPQGFRNAIVRFGKPIDPARYKDRPHDHLVYRQLIDEVMYEIRELTGQEYVDQYATKKAEALPAEPVRAEDIAREQGPRRSSADVLRQG
jgi:1-acyl-sn-glycerol-3-phosphate acyltransferase